MKFFLTHISEGKCASSPPKMPVFSLQRLPCERKTAMLYINIHSHRRAQNNEWNVENHYENFGQMATGGRFSAGLHPWYLKEFHWENDLRALKEISISPDVVAIGECGLDRVCKTDFSLQEKIFVAQVQLANQVQKPLIIHCVRAWDEVISVLKKEENKVPVVFHGFNKNEVLARKITSTGYYLSFGNALQYEQARLVISAVPIDKILLETDDVDIHIETVYEMAARALSIDINLLSLQIQKNAAAFFGAAAFGV